MARVTHFWTMIQGVGFVLFDEDLVENNVITRYIAGSPFSLIPTGVSQYSNTLDKVLNSVFIISFL